MFEVSTIRKDDSAELVFGGANELVNVSLSNFVTFAFVSTFVDLSGEFVASMLGKLLREEASLSMVVEEDAPAVSYGSRVLVEMRIDWKVCMFEVSTIRKDDSAELVFGGANELVIWTLIVPDDEPMWAADRVVALTSNSAITILKTANEFAIKGNHLTLIKGNQFDGITKNNPHKHIYEFLGICDMFKYRDTENEGVQLMMFPLSLTGEAKTWMNKLNEGTIETWDELRSAFINRFFYLSLFDRLLREIRAFSKHENESLTDAWLRMK
ncbi:reverse transcriptase domain-containing protein [Tanacetum coccineum]|uniref:Reverse transcriptase domain-containing protein n=1 Tax=Tanacetum coccineum TaxID=301880 RepID=A0ABQ4XMW5_9ASTR